MAQADPYDRAVETCAHVRKRARYTYVAVTSPAAAGFGLCALRSDGDIDFLYNIIRLPPLLPGLRYVEVAAGGAHMMARRNDGTIVTWGDNTYGQNNVPLLPLGVSYVGLDGGSYHTVARRSDGTLAAWGDNRWSQLRLPEFGPGVSVTHHVAGLRFSVALFDSGGFNTLGDGCRGIASPRLQPAALPRVGQTLAVKLVGSSFDPALLFTGVSNLVSALGPLPIDLSPLGLTDCRLRVSTEFTSPMHPPGRLASLAIPNDPALVGAFLYQQALQLSPGVNPAGLLLSEAATALIGN
jgi:hypothetical protein